MTRARTGEIVCYVIIGITALALLSTPFISAGIVVAALIGVVGGLLAFALGSRRLALVVAAFSILPLCGLIVIETLHPPASNGYLIFAPVIVVVTFALCSDRLLQANPRDRVRRVG